jgi:hypothetical protein
VTGISKGEFLLRAREEMVETTLERECLEKDASREDAKTRIKKRRDYQGSPELSCGDAMVYARLSSRLRAFASSREQVF